MAEPENPEEPEVEAPEAKPSLLRRVIAPAIAIMIFYASIRALPPLLVNQAPPIDGDDLLIVFLISVVFFGGLAFYLDHRDARKGPEE